MGAPPALATVVDEYSWGGSGAADRSQPVGSAPTRTCPGSATLMSHDTSGPPRALRKRDIPAGTGRFHGDYISIVAKVASAALVSADALDQSQTSKMEDDMTPPQTSQPRPNRKLDTLDTLAHSSTRSDALAEPS